MQSLLELQRSFAAELQYPGTDHIGRLIAADGAMGSGRFNIYRNNVRSALTNALAQIYPVIKELVGDEFFGFLAERYTSEFPSTQGNLHGFGDALAHFISGFGPVTHLPYLADVARVEWAYHCVFHAPAPQRFNPVDFEKVCEQDLCQMEFELGPACRLIRSPFPVFEIWRMHYHGDEADVAVSLDQGPETVLIVRHQAIVELQRLDAGCAALLDALRSRENLGKALETAMTFSPDTDWSAVLVDYCRSGVLLVACGSERIR